MSHPALSDLHPAFRPVAERIFALAKDRGLPLVLCQTTRDETAQLEAWARGRERKPDGSWVVTNAGLVVTHAMPGQSPHNNKPPLAIDACPAALIKLPGWAPSSPLWVKYGAIVVEAGAVWGGSWPLPKKDRPHAEAKDWRTLRAATPTV